MLRLHFTSEDLLNVRFAPDPAPLLELGLAMAQLQQTGATPMVTRWQHTARAALAPSALPLLELVPPNGTGPLFLDPISNGFDDGLDLVRSAPRAFVSAELQRLCATERRITPWITGLAEQDADAWHTLTSALRAANDTLLAPAWDRICQSVSNDVSWRSRVLAERGLQETLVGIFPGSHWQATVWCIPHRHTADLHLAGTGLTLLPCAFGLNHPLCCRHPDGSVLVLYPALTPLPMIGDAADPDPLSALLGPTRAHVLHLLAKPCTTTGIARELRISMPSASEHARTLRAAGLITTQRDGKSVRHVCTALGNRLLMGTTGTTTA
jgi:DNA-binding transcriptional ArsR family regulator